MTSRGPATTPRLRVLGPLEALVAGRPVQVTGLQGALLALLASDPGATLRISWPSGLVQDLDVGALDQHLHVKEPTA